jgi:hypothetical protein
MSREFNQCATFLEVQPLHFPVAETSTLMNKDGILVLYSIHDIDGLTLLTSNKKLLIGALRKRIFKYRTSLFNAITNFT